MRDLLLRSANSTHLVLSLNDVIKFQWAHSIIYAQFGAKLRVMIIRIELVAVQSTCFFRQFFLFCSHAHTFHCVVHMERKSNVIQLNYLFAMPDHFAATNMIMAIYLSIKYILLLQAIRPFTALWIFASRYLAKWFYSIASHTINNSSKQHIR